MGEEEDYWLEASNRMEVAPRGRGHTEGDLIELCS